MPNERAGGPASPIVFYGHPHPVTRRIYADIVAVIAALPEERRPRCELVLGGPDIAAPALRQVYLRPATIDAIPLVLADESRCADALRLKAAAAQQRDHRWRNMEKWELEGLLADEARLPIALTRLIGSGLTEPALIAARRRFRESRDATRAFGDPAGFLAGLDLGLSLSDIAVEEGRRLVTAQGRDGVRALARGWAPPGDADVRMADRRAVLRLAVPPLARSVRLTWDMGSGAEIPVARIAGQSAAQRAEGGEQIVALAPLDPFFPVVTIDLVASARALDEEGAQLIAIEVSSEGARPDFAPASSIDLVDAVTRAGFQWRRPPPPRDSIDASAPDLLGRPFFVTGDYRTPRRVLLISAEPESVSTAGLGLPPDVGHALAFLADDEGGAAGELEGWAPTPPGAGALCRELGGAAGWPDLAAAEFELIHLENVYGRKGLPELLGWLIRTLPAHGAFSGCERSAEYADQVVAGLAREGTPDGLVMILDGTRWKAVPRSCWAI